MSTRVVCERQESTRSAGLLTALPVAALVPVPTTVLLVRLPAVLAASAVAVVFPAAGAEGEAGGEDRDGDEDGGGSSRDTGGNLGQPRPRAETLPA